MNEADARAYAQRMANETEREFYLTVSRLPGEDGRPQSVFSHVVKDGHGSSFMQGTRAEYEDIVCTIYPEYEIHSSDEEALQTIDAAVFSGDPRIIRSRLTYFMERWQKCFAELDEDE